MSIAAYQPSDKVLAAHDIPHLLLSHDGSLRESDSTFNILSSSYLLSLLPLPVLLGGVGLLVVFAFVIGILLRLLLLSCKAIVRKFPGAENCHIFRCCVCCKKGCTHPESRCRHCCCCYKVVTEISRERATTSVSTQIKRHNFRRTCILEILIVVLVLLLVAAGMVFYGQQEIAKALSHISNAFDIVKHLFSGVADGASTALLAIEAVTVSLVTPPCSPWVPQAQQDTVLEQTAKLRHASDNIKKFAGPVVDKMASLSVFVTQVVTPTTTGVVLVFFLILVIIVYLYFVGECYESRLLMRTSLALSAVIVIALTAACCLVMVILTVLADFCIDPAANVLSLIDDKKSFLYQEVQYYTSCTTENPYRIDVDISVDQTQKLNSTFNVLLSYFDSYVAPTLGVDTSVTHSCSNFLFSKSTEVAAQVAKIQELIDCPPVNAFWNEAVNLGLCTWGFAGLYDTWLAFFVCSGLLFFGMVLAYTWYTWFLRLDVIGVGWFSDEEVADTEEYRYQVTQAVQFDFHAKRFGFGVLDDGGDGEGGGAVEEMRSRSQTQAHAQTQAQTEIEMTGCGCDDAELIAFGTTPRTLDLVQRGVADASSQLVEFSFSINQGALHNVRAVKSDSISWAVELAAADEDDEDDARLKD